MSYIKTVFIEGSAPGISAAELNKIGTGIEEAAPLASPALTGTPTAPTAAADTNTTQLATTAFVLANTSVGGTRVSKGTGTGANNTAVGTGALDSNTTGHSNVAVGNSALTANTAGLQCTAVGYQALTANLDAGFSCTAVGYRALANNLESSNTAVGERALEANTTGASNVAVGQLALGNNTTGSNNTAVGTLALNGTAFSNSSGLGHAAQVTASNQVQLGDSATTTYAYGAVQDRSDERDKADIRDTVLGLDFINALRPVDFKWDYREDYEGEKDGSKKRTRYHHGLIAQEVEALIGSTGIDFGGYQDHAINGGQDVKTIGYDELIAPMIKAIQELKAEFEAYKLTHP